MQILLDESIPKRLKFFLPGHMVLTVTERGWRSKKNGELLALADQEFDVFVTADQGVAHEQNLTHFRIGIIVLVARTNRIQDYEPLAPDLLNAIEQIRPGQLLRVAAVRRGPG